jgi:hypothetical protein
MEAVGNDPRGALLRPGETAKNRDKRVRQFSIVTKSPYGLVVLDNEGDLYVIRDLSKARDITPFRVLKPKSFE